MFDSFGVAHDCMVCGVVWMSAGLYLNEHGNFGSFIRSMVTLFRMATGENWNGMMRDCMIQPPFCSFEDGNFYFIALWSSPAARLHLRRAHSLSRLHGSHAHNFIAPPLDWRAHIHKTTLCRFIVGSRPFPRTGEQDRVF